MTDQERLRRLEEYAEARYDELYEVSNRSGVSGLYSEIKESLYEAIGLAQRLGKPDEAARLEKRLEHIKAVVRSQFT